MGIFEETVVKAKEVIDIAGKRTNEILSLQKLKLNLATLNSQLTREYETLGRLQYEQAQNAEQNGEAIAAQMEKINVLKANIVELEGRIAAQKGVRCCPACKSEQSMDAIYCNRCGQKLTFTKSAEEPEDADTQESFGEI